MEPRAVTVRPPRKAAPAEPKITKGERTRTLIKATIRELIAETGFSDLKLEDVCAKSGVTVGAFYFHFPSKDAALEEMWIEMNREFYGDILASTVDGDLEKVVKTLLRRSIDLCIDSPVLFRVGYWLIPRSFTVYKSWVASRAELIERLVSLTAARRGRPNRPSRADSLDVHFLMSGLEGFIENLFFGSDATMASIQKSPAKLTGDLWLHWRSVLFRPAAVEG
jgi:AcrR family transcriptional regulator